jgi:hypothetical protein
MTRKEEGERSWKKRSEERETEKGSGGLLSI